MQEAAKLVGAALALALTAAAALGQDVAEREPERTAFLTAAELLGTDITNANESTVGAVDDFVIDRGAGRIEYIVLEEGGILGLGGKRVAVPYGAFEINRIDDRYRLDVTPEQIEKVPEFMPGQWVELDPDTWREELADTYRAAVRAVNPETRDPYAAEIKGAETVTLEGTVKAVSRRQEEKYAEQIVVQVETGGGSQRVVLGPSWFVMSQPAAPMRGEEISVTAYRTQFAGEDRLVARRAVIGGRELALRSDDGSPRWDVTEPRSESSGQPPASPMMLLTDLIGMDARARGERSGEISGAVIEIESGRIAMLALDPDENFLGIADEIKAVPWAIVAIGPESVGIDADKDMLLDGEAMPDDVSVFSREARRMPVYSVYGVDPPEFEPRERREWNEAGLAGWGGDSALAKIVRKGDDTKVEGVVKRMTTTKLRNPDSAPDTGAPRELEAVAVVVETGGGTQTVALGPRWFIDRQRLRFGEGDRITVEGKVIRIGDREVVMASRITTGEGEPITFWKAGRPVWDGG